MTIDQALNALEEVMHAQLDQPVKGDFMSLTRAWREILEDFHVGRERAPIVSIAPLDHGGNQ